MASSPLTIAPLLLRNFITSLFFHADKTLISLSQKYELIQFLRCFLVSSFLFFLRLLPSFFPNSSSSFESQNCPSKSTKDDNNSAIAAVVRGGGESGVARALSQLLLIMNDIPVSSRKYDVVRSLAEKFIVENLSEGNQALKEVNCAVLSAAFARTLSQIEAAMTEQGWTMAATADAQEKCGYYFYGRARRLVRGVTSYGRAAWRRRGELSRSGSSAEKLAAELLWLAEKMAPCGCADEAVFKWASATKLAWLALSAEPRLQGSLVKVTAFFIKHAKEMGEEQGRTTAQLKQQQQQQHIRQTKMKLLMSWLPLLCSANNGTDAPVLNTGERAELERLIEEIISTLDEEEEQEQVLSLWLHHFTYCPSSDWPNLRNCYTHWFSASRKRLQLAAADASAD